MKNIRTPRTLADSQFVTGYSSAELLAYESMAHRWMYRLAACVAVAFAAGYLMEKFA